MSSEKKTIVINPKLLIPERSSVRRRRKAGANAGEGGPGEGAQPPPKIKLKSNTADSSKTIRRRALKHILKMQHEKYKRLLKEGEEPAATAGGSSVSSSSPSTGSTASPASHATEFNNTFAETRQFLETIVDQQQRQKAAAKALQGKTLANQTIKHRPVTAQPAAWATATASATVPTVVDVATTFPDTDVFRQPVLSSEKLMPVSIAMKPTLPFLPSLLPSSAATTTPPAPSPPPPPSLPMAAAAAAALPPSLGGSGLPAVPLPVPTYGCLKGGKLPTYRTLRGYAPAASVVAAPNRALPTPLAGGSVDQRAELKQFLAKKREETERVHRAKQLRRLVKPNKKQRRITKRTYRVGKSKVYPKVGVLVSNKTIRTNVLNKKQAIRETPMEDIRKYLVKHGLICVGSPCPNDVLRKMYESAMMMGGEVYNHNAQNLVYNFMHGAPL
jgi:hypothetical protein